MTGIVFAGLSPHPPVLIPEIGSGRELEEIKKTEKSMKQLAKQVKEVDPDLIITISPHGPVFSDAISILSQDRLEGDFSQFGRSDVKLNYKLHEEFTTEIIKACNTQDITVARIDEKAAQKFDIDMQLDHGVLVPMYYLNQAEIKTPLLPITMGMLPYEELYKLGKIIQLVADKLNYKVALIASGDLSHRLTPNAPAGFNPQGKKFDESVVEYLDDLAVEQIFDLDSSLIEKAGECGLRPIIIMLGALDNLQVSGGILSYEGPFGVGYAVASYRVEAKGDGDGYLGKIDKIKNEKMKKVREEESNVVYLARKTVEEYAENRELIAPSVELDNSLPNKAGVFVSIKKAGNLRGCIGTVEPTQETLKEEIIKNAFSAAFKDPRFEAINLNELDKLVYSVDILGEAVEVNDIDQLDPKKYGVIVTKGNKSGLLLPDLDGVDTAKKQIEIAKRKAGISLNDDNIKLMKFSVERYT